MDKKQSERLTPATSEARYPTLLELRREGGLLKSGLAAVVLASGLSGCGGKDDVSLSGKVDGSYFAQDVHGPDLVNRSDLGNRLDVGNWPDLSGVPSDATAPESSKPETSPPDQSIIIDGVPFIPYSDHLDGGIDSGRDASDDARDQGHDQRAGDARQDAGALDGQQGEADTGTMSTDSEIDLK